VERTTISSPVTELDLSTDHQLRAVLDELDPTADVAIDLADVTFCASTGIGTLIEAHNRHETAGGSLAILNPRPHIRKILERFGAALILLEPAVHGAR
jgi:anti-sigma B factor antagonist